MFVKKKKTSGSRFSCILISSLVVNTQRSNNNNNNKTCIYCMPQSHQNTVLKLLFSDKKPLSGLEGSIYSSCFSFTKRERENRAPYFKQRVNNKKTMSLIFFHIVQVQSSHSMAPRVISRPKEPLFFYQKSKQKN